MKTVFFLLASCISVMLTAQSWSSQANAPDCRYDGAGFSINGIIYYGLGIKCSGTTDNRFYKYDPSSNTWDTIPAFPGQHRRVAFGFAVGGKGYVGMGIEPVSGGALNDVWEFNPQTNSWTQKNNFPAAGRAFSFACATATKGYVGCGLAYMQFFGDFWEYNPATDTWTGQPSYPGGVRFDGAAFAIGGACYAFTGYDLNSSPQSGCWKFDTLTNTWTACASFPGPARNHTSAFVINGKGYAGYGGYSDFYSYDPATNIWSPEQANNDGAVIYDYSFSVPGAGFCVSEYVSAPDNWKFVPLSSSVADADNTFPSFTVSPNPASGIISVQFSETGGMLLMTDVSGKTIFEEKISALRFLFSSASFSPGIYILSYRQNEKNYHQKIIITQ